MPGLDCIRVPAAGESAATQMEGMMLRFRDVAIVAGVAACRMDPAGAPSSDATTDVDAPTVTDDASPTAIPDVPVDGPWITGAALQINDVSLLFPLPTTLAERDGNMLAASSVGPRGALLPGSAYDAVGRIIALSQEAPIESLRVVAMRLDPCFAVLAPSLTGDGCEAQLRLVMQPISEFASSTGAHPAFDASVHTFYRLTRPEVYALKDALVALRLASSGGEHLGPLAPHPLLVAQGLGGAYATGLRTLIVGAAGASNLSRIATMSSTGSAEWRFKIFDVDSTTGQVSPREIATLPAGTSTQSIVAFNINAPDASFNPPSASPDEFSELASTTNAASLTLAARHAQFEGLVRTENPRRTTPETVACASCHFAMTVKKRIAEPQYGLLDSAATDAFRLDPQLALVIDVRPRFAVQSVDFNVHAFSYNGNDAAIVQRTVNESAAIVEYFARSPMP
jgi:hypothetical protein